MEPYAGNLIRVGLARRAVPTLLPFAYLLVRVPSMSKIVISETFGSIQGESSYAGRVCFFIRLSGCNLKCGYCDTEHEDGADCSIDELVAESRDADGQLVEITGGEPLLQDEFGALATRLRDETEKTVLVETNGTCDISVIPDGVIAIMDVKTPSSGAEGSFDMGNIARLRADDEIKFVISDRNDYDWAKHFTEENDLIEKCSVVHFSPVYGLMDAGDLAKWIVEDGLHVKLQVQLHKILGVK
jgi:7-carboxy-7-deazaguanine synthase